MMVADLLVRIDALCSSLVEAADAVGKLRGIRHPVLASGTTLPRIVAWANGREAYDVNHDALRWYDDATKDTRQPVQILLKHFSICLSELCILLSSDVEVKS